MPGPLSNAHVVTNFPAQDLDRARRFHRDKLGLEPVEEREGGLRFICAGTKLHLFSSSGAASGTSTQMGFEVADLEAVIDDLHRRGVTFETVEVPGFERQGEMVVVPDNYPVKGSGEDGAFFYDSEGNLLALGQATDGGDASGQRLASLSGRTGVGDYVGCDSCRHRESRRSRGPCRALRFGAPEPRWA